jgi:galactokinase
MTKIVEKVQTEFERQFNRYPVIIRSPGRVNLIGEHTDYNKGYVLPATINRSIILAIAPNNLNRIRLHAIDMVPGSFQIVMNGKFQKSDLLWPNYVLGVVDQLRKSGTEISGFDCVFGGDIPIGAGLSSSASLVGGVIFGLSKIFDLEMSLIEMARLGQKAENDFVGVQCGIMDQFTNLFGRKGHAIKLDCRSMDFEYYPFNQKGIQIVLFDTKIQRELVMSEYNERRKQCEEGVRILNQIDPSVKSLRDVTYDQLQNHKEDFDPVIHKRCTYVVDENERVLSACNDLLNEDLSSFGKRMYQSHYGLRDHFEVSCKELDILVNATETLDSVLGSRMMGGGFGGCTINLILESELMNTIQRIRNIYKEKAEKSVDVYSVKLADGNGVVSELKKPSAGDPKDSNNFFD